MTKQSSKISEIIERLLSSKNIISLKRIDFFVIFIWSWKYQTQERTFWTTYSLEKSLYVLCRYNLDFIFASISLVSINCRHLLEKDLSTWKVIADECASTQMNITRVPIMFSYSVNNILPSTRTWNILSSHRLKGTNREIHWRFFVRYSPFLR